MGAKTYIGIAPKVTSTDYANWSNGSFTTTLDQGEPVNYSVEFDEAGHPVSVKHPDGTTWSLVADSDILDDTLPISFDTARIKNNTRISLPEGDVVRVSSWFATSDADFWSNAGLISISVDGEFAGSIPLIMAGAYADGVYMGMYIAGESQLIVLSVSEDNVIVEGFVIPKKGLYVQDISAVVGADVRCEFVGVDAPKMYFDEFPLDMTINMAALSALQNEIPLYKDDGTENGGVLKISDLTPTLRDLNNTYNTEAGYSLVYGPNSALIEGSCPEPTTLTWDWKNGEEGTFVSSNDNRYWVVYEEKTIHTTVFDVNVAISAHLTPGIYMSDKMTFGLAWTIITILMGIQQGSYEYAMTRICLGTTEDAERVLAEFNEIMEEGGLSDGGN